MIESIDLSYKIQGRQLVESINLQLEPGKLHVVLGPNGAGKSTLLKLLSQEINSTQGTVRINGESLQRMGVCHLARIRAVMVQHSHISFPFTVREIVEMGLMQKQSKNQFHLEEVMHLTQTWDFRERKIQELSGGEKQRVHFARALLQIWEKQAFPRYLLLDEPTSSMDIAQQHSLLEIASTLRSQHIGVMAILHDLNLAAQFADDIILMKKGRVIIQGQPTKVLQPVLLEEAYEHPIQVIYPEDLNYPLIIPRKKEIITNHTIKSA